MKNRTIYVKNEDYEKATNLLDRNRISWWNDGLLHLDAATAVITAVVTIVAMILLQNI